MADKKVVETPDPFAGIHGGAMTLSGGMTKKDLVEIEFLPVSESGKKEYPGKYKPGDKVFVSSSMAHQWCDRSGIAKRTKGKVTVPEVTTKTK